MNYSDSSSMIEAYKSTQLGWDGKRFHVLEPVMPEATATRQPPSTWEPGTTTVSHVDLPEMYTPYSKRSRVSPSRKLRKG